MWEDDDVAEREERQSVADATLSIVGFHSPIL
jgi:hypothetical protein